MGYVHSIEYWNEHNDDCEPDDLDYLASREYDAIKNGDYEYHG